MQFIKNFFQNSDHYFYEWKLSKHINFCFEQRNEVNFILFLNDTRNFVKIKKFKNIKDENDCAVVLMSILDENKLRIFQFIFDGIAADGTE